MVFICIFLADFSVLANPFAYVAYFIFLRDVSIRSQRADVASRRASKLATHLPHLATHLPHVTTHLPHLATLIKM